MYYTYVLQSRKDGTWYTGFTVDLRKRLTEHNNGKVFSTKGRGPFTLVYYEACLNKVDAQQRERYLKSGPGKQYLKNRLKRFLSLTGFTLIEGVIALAIISTALIVGLTLAYSNLIAAQNNSDRIIATNLAREGLEVMRNIRDSNWLRREANFDKDSADGTQFYAWDDFFDSWPAYNSATCDTDGCGNYFDVKLVSNTFSTDSYAYTLEKVPSALPIKDVFACLDGTQPVCRVRIQNSVYYQIVAAGGETPFYRRIGLKPICYNSSTGKVLVDDDLNMNCGSELTGGVLTEKGDKVGVLVISNVVWQRGSKILEVQLKERLYNWQSI
ncbi:MAG: GIY-YIG nuclease family protein [Candidatus Komeilibacteria bacterium]|nr:GIY-YIG nuclease family protein [Candidatus Komeilibacteria bacterium]